MSKDLRILIADDHEMVRRGLRSLLEARPDWEVCGEVENGRDAVEAVRKLKPDVAILDVSMPILNGLEAARQIRKEAPGCEVLILTMHHSEQLVREVLAVGARSYILKSDAGSMVVTAVEHLSKGKPFFTSSVSAVLLKAFLDTNGDGPGPDDKGALTARERETVQLVAEGKSSKEISTIMGISEKTVETHRTNLMRKLDIHSISEIVRYAIRNNLIEP
jgi:DNA-binding NarL/FixJ family response regulator